MFNFNQISKSVIEGDSEKVYELTKKAMSCNIPASEIIDKGLTPGLQEVGDFFEKGTFFLPELIVSGDAVSSALELLKPIMVEEGTPYKGKYLIGTVQGDVHDLGKNIVIMMLQGNGWDVTDLGIDVSPEEFCAKVETGDFQILGMSSLLTMTMPNAAKTIDALTAAGLRDKIKVMVGGAPTTPEWAERIGADAHAKNGPSAAIIAATLLGKSRRVD